MFLAILTILLFAAGLALLMRLAARSLPPRNPMVRRGKDERRAMSRVVEKYGRWSGGGGGGGGA